MKFCKISSIILNNVERWKKNMPNFAASSMSADGPAPLGVGTSTGVAMITIWRNQRRVLT